MMELAEIIEAVHKKNREKNLPWEKKGDDLVGLSLGEGTLLICKMSSYFEVGIFSSDREPIIIEDIYQANVIYPLVSELYYHMDKEKKEKTLRSMTDAIAAL